MCTVIYNLSVLISFSRQRWHDFYGHEEYLLYRNQERNFEVGTTETFPGLFKASHFCLLLIVLRLHLGARTFEKISRLKLR